MRGLTNEWSFENTFLTLRNMPVFLKLTTMGNVKSSQHFHPYSLLAYQHLARRRKITRGERIEIYATGDRLTEFISAIPIRRPATGPIHTGSLMP